MRLTIVVFLLCATSVMAGSIEQMMIDEGNKLVALSEREEARCKDLKHRKGLSEAQCLDRVEEKYSKKYDSMINDPYRYFELQDRRNIRRAVRSEVSSQLHARGVH